MTEPLEARALNALWRNHPDTPVKDRWGERAHRLARANRNMLLSWAATQPDYRLLDCRNIGAATLAWIRANEPTGYMALVTYGTGGNEGAYLSGREHGTATLDVPDLSRFIDDALEDWSTRPDPEPSDQVAAYLARRIAENVVAAPDPAPTEPLDAAVEDFMAWLFRDGGAEPPRREYDDTRERIDALVRGAWLAGWEYIEPDAAQPSEAGS